MTWKDPFIVRVQRAPASTVPSATHSKLAKAQAGAAKAKVNCATEATLAHKNTGITQFKASLKLLGVKATK